MKLKALVAAAVLTFSMIASAQFIPARVQVQVFPGQISVQVFNPVYAPVICSGQVFGQTSYGQVASAYFIEQYLPVGAYRFAYVQTAFAPFVNGWANINCRPAGYWY